VASINIPYNFTTGQVADAEQVDANFAAIALTVNGNLGLDNLTTSAENTWLKLATVADRKIAWGSASTPSFGGGKNQAGSVSHGLGATPVVVLLTGNAISVFNSTVGNATSVVSLAYTSVGSSTFSWTATIVDGVSNNAGSFYWLAVA
jgi:hypothetical protein